MKKLLFVLSLVPALVHAADIKIATVDIMVLLRNHADYDRNETFLESKSNDLKKKTDAIKAEGDKLQSEGKKLMEQFRNPMLNAKAKGDIEKQLNDLQQKLIQIEQRYRAEGMRGSQELQEDRARLLKATTNDLRAKLKKFSEEKGYDLIIDSNVTAFANQSLDVTDEVLKEMGVDPAKAKGKAKDESK